MKYWQYLKSVVRHKWCVFVECCKLGIPLLGIVHDWSKFMPSEFIPYAENFYGESKDGLLERFRVAWNHHQKRNKHHWQYWVLIGDEDGTTALPMPDRYKKELLADWIGAGKAYGRQPKNNNDPDTRQWYRDNREKMTLHPDTRAWIEAQLLRRNENA